MDESRGKSTITAVIELVESVVTLYFDLLAKRSLKLANSTNSLLAALIMTLIITSCLISGVWFSSLGLLALILSHWGWSLITILATLVLINLVGILICAFLINKLRRQL